MTTKTRRKPWDHFPSRYYDDDRYLDLSAEAALAFHRMHTFCDRWGHFAASKRGLAGDLRLAKDVDTEAVWSELKAAGPDPLVTEFISTEGLRCGRIEEYDRDAPEQVVRKRGPSEFQPVPTSSNQLELVPTSSNHDATRAREETRDKRQEIPPSAGDARAGAHTHTCASAREDGAGLGQPAKDWLHRRAQVSKAHGDFSATWARVVELHGQELERLQVKPGFAEAVTRMLQKPDSTWGKSVGGGIGLLRKMVTDHIPPEDDRAPPVDQHFAQPMSREEFDRCNT